ncbi:MAG: tsaB [Bacteroidetes bacterium]|nr:tsaB [Bacteroidota bacterium]
MAFILNIDTSSPVCSVCLSDQGRVVLENNDFSGNKHASILNTLIFDLLARSQLRLSDVSAIAISSGPGSYTGLRIGASVAKGICYGLGIPLIAIPTLMGIASQMSAISADVTGIFVPMIDARREDVYMAVYDHGAKILQKDSFVTIDVNLFDTFLRLYDSNIYFGGPGSYKMIKFSSNIKFGTIIENIQCVSSNISSLSYESFIKKEFVDLTYYEPFYLKEFEGRMKIK